MFKITQLAGPTRLFFRDNIVLLALGLASLLVHLAVNIFGSYGYIRDELYYLACSDHLAWGYVDHPSLSIALLWLSRLLFGDSLVAIRLFPALSGALVVILTGLTTKELGGKKYGQALAALCVMVAPIILGVDSVFSMNAFEVLFWTLACYLLVRILKKGERRQWLLLGLVLGLGLLNKISVLWLGMGIAVGLVLTPQRKLLLQRDPWLAGIIAILIFSPYVIWQFANNYATLEFMQNISAGKYSPVSPVQMFVEQTFYMNPVTLPIWLAGLVYFLFAKSVKQFRLLPLIYVTVFIILAINKNVKTAYLAPTFPLLFTLGAFAVARFFEKFRRPAFIKSASVLLIVVTGIAFAPVVLATLPVRIYTRYASFLGLVPSTSEDHQMGQLPQYYADMFGWQEMAAAVAQAFEQLSPAEKSACVIFCDNYGEAGAIDFFGRRYNLPKAISGHNNYWLWGPGEKTGAVVIQLGGSEEALRREYDEVIPAGITQNNFCMPYENNVVIWICKKRHTPLAHDWAKFKKYG